MTGALRREIRSRYRRGQDVRGIHRSLRGRASRREVQEAVGDLTRPRGARPKELTGGALARGRLMRRRGESWFTIGKALGVSGPTAKRRCS